MSATYQELFDEVPTIRLRNIHQQDLNNLIFIETDPETGQWTCCWKVCQPLNGCEAMIVPIAFEVCGRLSDGDSANMGPIVDEKGEEHWFPPHWYLEAMGLEEGHHAIWEKVQQAITQIARCAPVPLDTTAVLHHNSDMERKAVAFGWQPGMAKMPCVYVESIEDKNVVRTVLSDKSINLHMLCHTAQLSACILQY